MNHNKHDEPRHREDPHDIPPLDEAHLSEDPLTDPDPQPEGSLADWLPVAVPADGDGPLP